MLKCAIRLNFFYPSSICVYPPLSGWPLYEGNIEVLLVRFEKSALRFNGGGGRIRTHGPFGLRFSRPSPSSTRPLLHKTKRRGNPLNCPYLTILSIPILLTKTSGIITEPSSCWKFSSIAANVRPIARPEPLSVCTNSVPFLPSLLNLILALLA